MTILQTDRLIIRNWKDGDRDLFFEINSDDRVMEFFPFRRNRAETDAVFARLQQMIAETGFGFYALELKSTAQPIGFVGLVRTDMEPHIPAGTVEVGWRLAARYWGKGLATEAARAALAHGFGLLNLDEIVSFAVHDNHRSTAVMKRIGMRQDIAGGFDHPNVPDTHPHLKRHVLYRLTAAEWRDRQPV
jgi:RimJ/RimL family protein N-acetyltransferase